MSSRKGIALGAGKNGCVLCSGDKGGALGSPEKGGALGFTMLNLVTSCLTGDSS